MKTRLDGKNAIVTGGSRGIGSAIAQRFAAEGASVAFTYSGNSAAAAATVNLIEKAGGRATSIQADARDPSQVRAAVDKAVATFGSIDVLVHNAGISEYQSILQVDDATYDDLARRHFSVNVEAVASMTKAALPHFRDGGRIIMVGSVNAHQMPFEGTAIYGASKAALGALAQGWARDLGSRNILVNAIRPGPINTDMNPDDDRDAVTIMTAMTALKRYGRPEEIAALAAFLASDESSYITGTSIDVDGGFSV